MSFLDEFKSICSDDHKYCKISLYSCRASSGLKDRFRGQAQARYVRDHSPEMARVLSYLQAGLDVEALWRFDVLEVDTAKGRLREEERGGSIDNA